MRITNALIFIIFFISTISGNNFITYDNGEGDQLCFETIILGYGYDCDHINKSDYAINTQQEWENLWNLTFSDSWPIPIVLTFNFTENTIIASYLGSKPTGGYSIEIIEIVELDDHVNVRVEEKNPNKGDYLTQGVTEPYHIVKANKISKSIIFTHIIIDSNNQIFPFTISLVILFSICAICGIVSCIGLSNKIRMNRRYKYRIYSC